MLNSMLSVKKKSCKKKNKKTPENVCMMKTLVDMFTSYSPADFQGERFF